MQKPNAVWPWFFSAIPLIACSTAYAVLWWSGDVFGEQLTMSVAEFVMSLAVNSICVIVVAFYYFRLRGYLTSVRPKGVRIYDDVSQESSPEIPDWRQEREIPDWRQGRDGKPPKLLEKSVRRKRAAMETGFRNVTSGRHNDARRSFGSRRGERGNIERPIHGPYNSRETLRRASLRRRLYSEPRASQSRSCQNGIYRSRSPSRAFPPRPSGLTPDRLKAHDSTMEKLCRSRPIASLARHPKYERNSAV
ncbi:unnamed protein product [Toxocara canis]|uniref:Uncharacterized protein n=1 Tax=Toxocara canis TaxID=6265 RepID=A0A183TY96_TOXCA|nr:unnamed protein product [Toxocara canis]